MTKHYLEQMKNERMGKILFAIEKSNKCKLSALKIECYDKLGIAPSLFKKYLVELEGLGKIEVDEQNNLIIPLKKP